MAVLESPDGVRYETDDEQEIQNLMLGHGYRKLDEPQAAPKPMPAADPVAGPAVPGDGGQAGA